MLPVRTYHVLGAHALHVLTQRAEDAVASWAARWCRRHTALRVGAVPAWEQPARREAWHRRDGVEAVLWFEERPQAFDALAHLLLGPAAAGAARESTDWASHVVHKARAELQACLMEAFAGGAVSVSDAAGLDDAVLQPGSGAVRFECELLSLTFITSAEALRHVPPGGGVRPRLEAIASLPRAAATRSVTLAAHLGSVDIELGHLLGLQAGDVLRLPTRLDDPITLRAADGSPLARCALGERGGMRAVRVIARADA